MDAKFPDEPYLDRVPGFWVSGLPPEISVITVGQNYVVTGDHVNVNISNN